MKRVGDKFKVLEENLGSPEAEAGVTVSSIRLGGQEIQYKSLKVRHYQALVRHITHAYIEGAFEDARHGELALAIIWKSLGYSRSGFRAICLNCLNTAVEISHDGFLVTRYKTWLQKRANRTVVLPMHTFH